MSFSSEIFREIKSDFLEPFEYNLVVKNGKIAYLDGFSKVLFLSKNELRFKIKNKCLKIVGEDLKIEKLEELSCVIVGKMVAFYEQ